MNGFARLLLINAVMGLAACAGWLWYCQGNFAYVYRGADAVSAADVVKLDDPAQLKTPWVRFTASQLIPTGAELVRTDSDRVLGRIYLVQVEDRWLLGLLNPTETGNEIEVELIAGRPYWPKEIGKVTQETMAIHNGQLLPFVALGYDDHFENNEFGFYFFLFCAALSGLSLIGGLCALFLPPDKADEAAAEEDSCPPSRFAFPDCCARCLAESPEKLWKVESGQVKTADGGDFTMHSELYAFHHEVHVPICRGCYSRLKAIRIKLTAATLLLAAIAAGALWYYNPIPGNTAGETFRNYALLSMPLFLVFCGVYGLLGAIFAPRRTREVAVLSKTGDEVAFYNREYQRRFVELANGGRAAVSADEARHLWTT